MIVWPAVLPLPQFGLRYNVADPQMRTLMASGRTIVRRRFSDVPTDFQARWILRQSEAEIFEQFYQNDAVDGSEWIEMPLVTPQGESVHYVRFRGGYSARRVGLHLWEYSANLQMYLRPGSPEWPPGAGGDPGPGTDPILKFTGNNQFTLSTGNNSKNWDGQIEYSADGLTWAVWAGAEISSVGNVLFLRGTGNTNIAGSSPPYRFVFSGAATEISALGNIDVLLDWEAVRDGIEPTRASWCYGCMFYGCTSLVSAPALPAMTLSVRCYDSMFDGCTSLVSAPALPAMTLSNYCYSHMFDGCTSLVAFPALPAVTLPAGCYSYMFTNCTSLRVSSTSGGIYTTPWRLPTSGTGSIGFQWNTNMLQNTGGPFVGNPLANTTYWTEHPPVS